MKKILIASLLVLSFPMMAQANSVKSNTVMSVNYEDVNQLIKNQYAAREGCRSIQETPETSIMCQYADAASRELDQLGYCYGEEGQSMAESQWEKCKRQPKIQQQTPSPPHRR